MAEARTAEPRAQKKAEVAEISTRFRETDAILLTEYRGLRVADIREVRNALREADSDYKVLKNTLARLAVREVGLEDLVALLEGPTAIAFVRGDVAAAAKALDEAVKKFPVLSIKGGVLNGKVLDADQARALAKLESREVLLTKIAMLFNQPAQQTVNVFAALLRDLGSMLGQVLAQKESEAPAPSAEAEVAPAGEATPETTPAAPPGDETLDQPEVEEAEKAEEAAAADESTSAGDETEAAAETAAPETPAEAAAIEAEPPAELAEAVDQAPAAPESEAAETQETDGGDKEE
ncbi:MAG TPA: 50S ribosomal protein L10 [Actinomycetota bacterium]|nr:50S ribosomal protein L10 [Actinomycetota bacterium]